MPRRTHAGHLSIFEGLPPEKLARVLESLETRAYPAGATVVAEGDRTKEIFIAQSGSADVVIAGQDGVDRLVGRIVPGGTVGEISLLTGQPAVATVRAGADFEAIVLSETDFASLAESFPEIYRNLGTILAERLARTDRLAVGEREGHLTLLEDAGAPPLLGYALACSVAWHTRERTLLARSRRGPTPGSRRPGDGFGRAAMALLARPKRGRRRPDDRSQERCVRAPSAAGDLRSPLSCLRPDSRARGCVFGAHARERADDTTRGIRWPDTGHAGRSLAGSRLDQCGDATPRRPCRRRRGVRAVRGRTGRASSRCSFAAVRRRTGTRLGSPRSDGAQGRARAGSWKHSRLRARGCDRRSSARRPGLRLRRRHERRCRCSRPPGAR